MVNNSLSHHGVLGMKWGVRRSKKQLARARGSSKKTKDIHEDYRKAHSGKSVKSMSDKELQSTNRRLQMEQQYSQLSQTKVSAGRKVVTGIVIGAATAVAGEYAKKYMKKGVEYAIKKSIKKI